MTPKSYLAVAGPWSSLWTRRFGESPGAGPDSWSPSHNPNQEQGIWEILGAKTAPGTGHQAPPSEWRWAKAGPGHGPAGSAEQRPQPDVVTRWELYC